MTIEPTPEQPVLGHGAADEAFSCHRGEMPLIWMLGGLAAAELIIVHLLISMWSGTAAWILTALTLAAVAQAAAKVRAMITRPILVGERAVRIRFRTREPIVVPFKAIAQVEYTALTPAPKGAGVFRGTLLAHPNILLRLACPLPHGRRRIDRIALHVDAPTAFRSVIDSRLARLRADNPAIPPAT